MGVVAELNPVNAGIDVGQVNDPASTCVCEVSRVDTGKVRQAGKVTLGRHDHRGYWIPPKGIDPVMRSDYTVRHIARIPLGTGYPELTLLIADMLSNNLFQNRQVRVLIDITGVGRPVWQALAKELALRPQCKHIRLKPTSFVAGEKYNRSKGTLGKGFLVTNVQELLQWERIHGPNTPEMIATVEELRNYKVKTSDEGKLTYGAFKVGTHDDLATALGLACLEDPFSEKVTYSEKVY